VLVLVLSEAVLVIEMDVKNLHPPIRARAPSQATEHEHEHEYEYEYEYEYDLLELPQSSRIAHACFV
jgi:hypothetical protein